MPIWAVSALSSLKHDHFLTSTKPLKIHSRTYNNNGSTFQKPLSSSKRRPQWSCLPLQKSPEARQNQESGGSGKQKIQYDAEAEFKEKWDSSYMRFVK